jgi:hypothetical protein
MTGITVGKKFRLDLILISSLQHYTPTLLQKRGDMSNLVSGLARARATLASIARVLSFSGDREVRVSITRTNTQYPWKYVLQFTSEDRVVVVLAEFPSSPTLLMDHVGSEAFLLRTNLRFTCPPGDSGGIVDSSDLRKLILIKVVEAEGQLEKGEDTWVTTLYLSDDHLFVALVDGTMC